MSDNNSNASPFVSIVIVTWNSAAVIGDCLNSLAAQTYCDCEIIVIDNCSSDQTCAIVRAHSAPTMLIKNQTNAGFADAANQGFENASGDVLIELNPDTRVEPDWIEPLLKAVASEQVGLATSRIMLADRPYLINACGNETSLTGLTSCIDVGRSANAYAGTVTQSVPAISGAAFAMRRDVYEHIGGFDADYFTYFEDTDLSWRARLAGYEVVLAAQSVVYHHYSFGLRADKLFWIERNRYLTFFKIFERRTLWLLLPALLLGELIVWAFAMTKGPAALLAKWRANYCVWASRRVIAERHRVTQALRLVSDRQLVAELLPCVQLQQALPKWIALPFEKLFSGALKTYARFVTIRLATGVARL